MLTLAVVLAACTPQPEEYARARVIEDLDDAIGGPKALARPGDFLLENDHLRIAVLAARDSMGPGLYGGSIVDADLQRGDARFEGGNGLDSLTELIPSASINVAKPEAPDGVRIVADGSDGGAAIVRVESVAVPFLEMLRPLWALVSQPEMYLRSDYIVEPGTPWVTIETTVVFGWDGSSELPEATPVDPAYPGFPIVDLAVERGVVLGDFYLQGGSVDVFGPNLGFDEDGAVFEARQRGENLMLNPFTFEYLAGTGDGVSYALAPAEGVGAVPLFTASQTAMMGGGVLGDGTSARFAPGTAFSYRRWFFVGTGDVGSVLDHWIEAKGIPYGEIDGVVLEEGTEQPISDAHVFAYEPGAEAPWAQWRTDHDVLDTRADGSFHGRLPVGNWELLVHKAGRPDGHRIRMEVREGETRQVALVSPRSGLVDFTVRDERGRVVPAKVTMFRQDGPSRRDPVLGDGFVAGDPDAVLFAAYGTGEVELGNGTYVAVASRGLEYEIDVSEPFTVTRATRTHLDLTVVHSVESDGWISADLHVHGQPSHDVGISLPGRVTTMVCEGVDFFSATDHDYLTDYAPTIEAMGLSEWVGSAVGEEVTTVEIGHFLAFPMAQHFTEDAGGAVDWTGLPPGDIFAGVRQRAGDVGYDPVLTVAHPRDGILGYFDQYGFDPYGGIVGSGDVDPVPRVDTSLIARTNPLLAADNVEWSFDALEVMGTKNFHYLRTPTQPELDRFAEDGSVAIREIAERTMAEQTELVDGVYRLGYGRNGQIDDWFTLLNLGFRYTALGNSDTHGWTSTEAGCPRNYVLTGTDDPALLDEQEVADAVKAHRVVATYGPMIRIWVDGHDIGSEVPVTAGSAELTIEVQAPTWMAVDRVELYENGTLIDEIAVPETGEALRLLETFTITPTRDAWYVAVATGDDDLSPVFTPVEIPDIPLNEVVLEALAGVEAVGNLITPATPVPLTSPVFPYAITNPIWVDLGGDGFTPPGLPSWLRAPIEPGRRGGEPE